MSARTVRDNPDKPMRMLRWYGTAALPVTVVVLLLVSHANPRAPEQSLILGLLVLAGMSMLAVGYCVYHTEDERRRDRFIIQLGMVHAVLALVVVAFLRWPPKPPVDAATVVGVSLGAIVLALLVGGCSAAMGRISEPAWSLVFRPKRRFSKPVECVECGYSLVGNISGTCPECGASAPAATGTGQDPALLAEHRAYAEKRRVRYIREVIVGLVLLAMLVVGLLPSYMISGGVSRGLTARQMLIRDVGIALRLYDNEYGVLPYSDEGQGPALLLLDGYLSRQSDAVGVLDLDIDGKCNMRFLFRNSEETPYAALSTQEPVLMERFANRGGGRYVLFADGHAEYLQGGELQQAYEVLDGECAEGGNAGSGK